ncbi:MAG: type II secretion system F family protein [Stenotrophomonas nitritireducens]|uniref:type II secretion system F family protein n=1 Tax=Stenotrophomonas nitritireducens TaxID=83617 RepID=UPI001AD23958|nr:type II secretion system F family protein [Stenotrophomonas nitritireducens]MBN8793583.1 type II secretion system F family protein [Stenotrophomonas nitritireducens]MBN8797154.1 type II secretion system F family protein [Stenotrophomonas nitritireducens]
MTDSTGFRYEAFDRAGKRTTGSLEAADEAEAIRALAGQGLTVSALAPLRPAWRGFRRGKASMRELQLMLHEFTTLLEAGVRLATALSSLAHSSHHAALVAAFAEMERMVRRGESFSTAMRASGLPVPEYFHQLVHAGEATGRLAESLRGGVEQFEYDQRVRQEMTGALIYPLVLVGSGIAAVGIIFMWVVPRFGGLLTQHGDSMPALSRWVISTGVWLSAHAWLVLAMVAASLLALRALFKLPGFGARLFERAARLPVLGEWLIEAEVGRWASTLSALLSGKVELIRALNLAAASVRMGFLRDRLGAVAKSVKAGKSISVSLREHRALNDTGYDLVAVGEASGELPKLLAALGKLYETIGRDRMKRTLQLVEPLAIILIGVVVGTIMTAIILAITSVNDVRL